VDISVETVKLIVPFVRPGKSSASKQWNRLQSLKKRKKILLNSIGKADVISVRFYRDDKMIWDKDFDDQALKQCDKVEVDYIQR